MQKCRMCGGNVEYNWGDEIYPVCHLCARTMNENDWDRLYQMGAETCEICGDFIPDGRTICKKCEVNNETRAD